MLLVSQLGDGISVSRAVSTIFDVFSAADSDLRVAGLLAGMKWGGMVGEGVGLTTSFSTSDSVYVYASDEVSAVAIFRAKQIDAARLAMSAWTEGTALSFVELPDNPEGAGDIRWGQSKSTSVVTAFAYAPDAEAWGGDIWFGPWVYEYREPVPGEYGYFTFMHELGHALGLEHPHHGAVIAEARDDQLKYTVMSYRDHVGDALDGYETAYFPTTPMLHDILAIQWLYGANADFRTGDDVYRWDVDAHVFETIWDGGGNDLIDAGNQSQGVLVDLRQGAWSEIGIAFWNGQSDVRDCLTIAYGTVIENAIGSEYDDVLFGNKVANTLFGGMGNDRLEGRRGADSLSGGFGDDVLMGGSENDTLRGNDGDDTLIGGVRHDNLRGGEGGEVLLGGAGKDTLRGGAGEDQFVFDRLPVVVRNFDVIIDFSSMDDTLLLDGDRFNVFPVGVLDRTAFLSISSSSPDLGNFVGMAYDTETGFLYYSPDAIGLDSAILIAQFLNKPMLSSDDFFIV